MISRPTGTCDRRGDHQATGALHRGSASSGTDLRAVSAAHRSLRAERRPEAIAAHCPAFALSPFAPGRGLIRRPSRALAGWAGVAWLPAGSLRRGQDMVGYIEIVAAATDPARATNATWRSLDVPTERSARVSAERSMRWRPSSRRNAGAALLR